MEHKRNLLISLLVFVIVAVIIAILPSFDVQVDILVNPLTTLNTTLLGISIAITGIYFALPLRSDIHDALIKQKHYKAIARDLFIASAGFCLGLLFSLISSMLCLGLILNILIILASAISLGALTLLMFSMWTVFYVGFSQKNTK